MGFCLPLKEAKKFIEALKDGTINPEKMIEMTSAERRSFLEKIVGDDAKEVNALFESKLLLKDQKRGLVTWAKKVSGISPEVRRGLIEKINKMEEILTPETEDKFLEDLAAKRLGTEVTMEEAGQIAKLSQEIKNAKETGTDRMDYGRAVIKLEDYVESLKGHNKEIVANVANIPKTLFSTVDLSAPLRQGWGMASRPQFYSSFVKMFKYAASEGAFQDLRADIVSRPTYEQMKGAGLRISSVATKLSQREEQFMSNLLGKLPLVRNSERAYVGFLNKLRADVFDSLLKAAELRGEDIHTGSQATKDIANVINDFTGSGNIGKGDRYANITPTLNAAFFSPRKISATLNMFNPERYINPRISPTARYAAIRQLVGSIILTTTALQLARLAGAKVSTDPTSSDFGKAVFGKTHYDFTGGNANFGVLLSRLATNKVNGKPSKTPADQLVTKYFRNKLAPLAALIVDWKLGKDAVGNKVKFPDEILNKFVPGVAQDVEGAIKNDPTNTIGSFLGSEFGVGVQSY